MGFSADANKNQIISYLQELEKRISRIEAHLNLQPLQADQQIDFYQPTESRETEASDALEFHIGQFWSAKIGIIILALGIAFLLTFPYEGLHPAIPSLVGYAIVVILFLLSYWWQNTYSYLSRYLTGGVMVLFYFSTLRLHFFSNQPYITDQFVVIIPLFFIVLINLYISARRKSIYLTGLNLFLGYVTAIVSENSYLLFGLTVFFSALTVYFVLKYQWLFLIFLGVFCAYFSHLIWYLNNPFLGNPMEFVDQPPANLFFILVYLSIFAAAILFREKDMPENNPVILSSFLNISLGYGLFTLISITMVKNGFAAYHLLSALLLIGISILFWTKRKSTYSTFFYAMIGYLALSVVIVSQFQLPNFFVWLCWQSLLVVSTAIWFRSKIIIVANFLIYLGIFITYLVLAGKIGLISLSFGIVALLSARILNWRKHHLELKTEMMRNAYLVVAFFIFPYALYFAVPSGYISLSWMGIAIFYYFLSLILNNRKYRWMALLTLLLTVVYVLIIGMIQLEPVYRIITFIALGIILLILSVIYTKLWSKGKGNT